MMPSTNQRPFWRKVVDTSSAYIRIDLVEERMFPLSTVLRFMGVVFPILLYFFQSRFLHIGRDQFAFMLIGTAVTAGLTDALTGLTARLQFAQERGTLETYLVEPVPWALIPIAMNIWRSMAGAALACFMIAVGWAFGAPLRLSGIPLAILVLLLGVAACNMVGTFAGSFLVLFKRGEPVIMFYSLAATVLGGTLFPTSVLPSWIRWASYLVPHSYVISAERNLLMAEPSNRDISPSLSIMVLVCFCTVGLTVGLYVFDRALSLARKLGVLAI
jgi:ABC-2 type transport system permease protein